MQLTTHPHYCCKGLCMLLFPQLLPAGCALSLQASGSTCTTADARARFDVTPGTPFSNSHHDGPIGNVTEHDSKLLARSTACTCNHKRRSCSHTPWPGSHTQQQNKQPSKSQATASTAAGHSCTIGLTEHMASIHCLHVCDSCNLQFETPVASPPQKLAIAISGSCWCLVVVQTHTHTHV